MHSLYLKTKDILGFLCLSHRIPQKMHHRHDSPHFHGNRRIKHKTSKGVGISQPLLRITPLIAPKSPITALKNHIMREYG